jgi:hypothetical protein
MADSRRTTIFLISRKAKVIFMSRILMIFVLFSFLSTGLGAAQTYPLVCKGGGEMSFLYSDYHEQISPPADPEFSVLFKAAPQSTTNAPLKNGECSWVDRPMSREPQTLCFTVYGYTHIAFKNGNLGMQSEAAGTIYRANIQFKDPNTGKPQGQIPAFKAGQQYIFQVYNRGNCMAVTRSGM